MAEFYYNAPRLAGLPGMPGTSRSVNRRAQRERWAWIPHRGFGGGRDYAASSLPVATQIALGITDTKDQAESLIRELDGVATRIEQLLDRCKALKRSVTGAQHG